MTTPVRRIPQATDWTAATRAMREKQRPPTESAYCCLGVEGSAQPHQQRSCREGYRRAVSCRVVLAMRLAAGSLLRGRGGRGEDRAGG